MLTDAKKSLVVSRLSRRLRSLEIDSFDRYCDLVESESGHEERQSMISALTTNVTRFFREDHHFRQLTESVLPPLVARARAGGRVRIWSAGCSSGEEPYSIALTLLDLCPEAPRLNIRMLASDIDPNIVEIAKRGRYTQQAVDSVPARLRAGLVKLSDGKDVEVGQPARSIITFGQLNLLREWPFKGRFDVIFCRNVVIYFDAATQDTLWQRFAAALESGGHLFIGHSERLSPAAQKLFRTAGITSYQRLDTGATASKIPSPHQAASEPGRTPGWA